MSSVRYRVHQLPPTEPEKKSFLPRMSHSITVFNWIIRDGSAKDFNDAIVRGQWVWTPFPYTRVKHTIISSTFPRFSLIHYLQFCGAKAAPDFSRAVKLVTHEGRRKTSNMLQSSIYISRYWRCKISFTESCCGTFGLIRITLHPF